jgi:iron complex transport system substrate-binding protein
MNSTDWKIPRKACALSSKSASPTGKINSAKNLAILERIDLAYMRGLNSHFVLQNGFSHICEYFAGTGSGEGRENRPRSRHCKRLRNSPQARLPAHAAETGVLREKERGCHAPRCSWGFFFFRPLLRQGSILNLGNSASSTSARCAALFCALLCAAALRAQAPTAPPTQEKTAPSSVAVVPSATPAYREVQDELGRTVKIPQPVNRIVSLAPSLTETVYALGQQSHLVGDTEYCDYPPEAKSITKVGGVINPSIEQVASLHPDLVLVAATNRFETVRALDDLNIPVYQTDPHTVDEIISSTAKLGDILGASQNGAALAAQLQQRLADLRVKLADQTARRVLFIVWTDPLISIGKNTFIADALTKAGAISIVDSAQDWPHPSLEEVVRLQPEYLIFTAQNDEKAPDPATLAVLPGWRSLDAVKNHRFAVISDALDRPAPRLISAIEDLAHQLHADAFAPGPPNPSPAATPVIPDSPRKESPAPEKSTPPSSKPPVTVSSFAPLKNEASACNR